MKTEIVLYTWKDATLKELVEQLRIHVDQCNNKQAKFKFSSVYKDPRGNFKRKDLGTQFTKASAGTTGTAETTH